MVGAAAYAANDGASGNWDSSWSQGPGSGIRGGGWGGGGGMMGRSWSQGTSTDTPAVAPDQATTLAKDWAAANLPGATLDAGLQMPMGYLFVARENGKVVAHVLVNDDTGRVLSVDGANFGGMMGRGWENGIGGTEGGAMMGQGRLAGSSMMNGRGF
jgi:hypothetical protein